MNTIKLLKNDQDYQAALARLDALMDADPGSLEEEELALLSYLVDKYEAEHFPIELPDPVEAIKFRMEQQDLTRKDLIPYIGSQSKVSEVLNRKRPLSLSMMRALHEGLGIPAEVLLQEPGKTLNVQRFNPDEFPLNEMFKAGYFAGIESLKIVKEQAEELLERLLSPLEKLNESVVYCRNTLYAPLQQAGSMAVANGKADYAVLEDEKLSVPQKSESHPHEVNEKALRAWQARVLQICGEQRLPGHKPERITREFIRNLVRLSAFPDGPLMARQALWRTGIHFVVLPHLSQTYLDGACFKTHDDRVVIGMTLRHDRLDNFWFTLTHELAHAWLHLDEHNIAFFDDTEHGLRHACSVQEQEANQLAMNLLVSDEIWEAEKENLIAAMDEASVVKLAQNLGISPAIVAGRLRWELNDYTLFPQLIGAKSVRVLFAEYPGFSK